MTVVRTRFAPSPTGYMHIGGMRTALFNWLWARHNGGSFILRIDDTDRARNIDEAIGPILGAFRWLELDWDEGPGIGGDFGPYFQSERGDLYRAAAEKLLATGCAYRDFDTPDQIRQDRETADREKRNYVTIRRSLELTVAERQQYLDEGRPHVIRFLIPRDQTISLDDAVRGTVEWSAALLPDPVIVRGDGSPLYNFATVVDDAQMQITHVVRAEEHLSNTPIQVLIHQALGNTLPVFAHIPFVAAPGSKEKLSKRKLDQYRKNPQFRKMFAAAEQVFPRIGLAGSQGLDPVMIEFYRQVGFIPQAIVNSLARIGWSLDDRTEIMSPQTIVQNFSLDRIVKSPAGLDPDKLLSFQSHWMNELTIEQKVDGCLPWLTRAGIVAEPVEPTTYQFLRQLVRILGDRLTLFGDILKYDDFLTPDSQLRFDEKTIDKRLRKPDNARELLSAFRDRLASIEPFDAVTTDKLLHDFVEAEGIAIGEIIHALRVAVTGQAQGPGMFDCLELLGRDRCLARIGRALELATRC